MVCSDVYDDAADSQLRQLPAAESGAAGGRLSDLVLADLHRPWSTRAKTASNTKKAEEEAKTRILHAPLSLSSRRLSRCLKSDSDFRTVVVFSVCV